MGKWCDVYKKSVKLGNQYVLSVYLKTNVKKIGFFQLLRFRIIQFFITPILLTNDELESLNDMC